MTILRKITPGIGVAGWDAEHGATVWLSVTDTKPLTTVAPHTMVWVTLTTQQARDLAQVLLECAAETERSPSRSPGDPFAVRPFDDALPLDDDLLRAHGGKS